MSIQRAFSFSLLLCVATACARVSNSSSRSEIAPETPKAWIYASYTGGLFDRTTYASFSVYRPSYVMVAHLSGEGVIRVLYPEDPRQMDKKIVAEKTMRTRTFMAPYDGLPSLYTNTVSPLRNLGARINSYDGLGHAYIFLIASDKPLRVDEMSGGGLWDEIEVPNYNWALDPRRFIRDFADQVADGAPYTLKYADSYRTSTYTTYADNQWACSALSTLPYAVLASLSYYTFGFQPYRPSSCYYSLLDSYYYRQRPRYDVATTVPTTVVPVPIPTKKPDTVEVLTSTQGHPTSPTNPIPRRKVLAGEAAEEFTFPTRPRPIDSEREIARPRRADGAAWTDSRPTNTERPRQATSESASGTRDVERVERTERVERPQPERTERAPVERAERPQVERVERPQSPPPQPEPRAEPRETPPPPRPRPPGNQ